MLGKLSALFYIGVVKNPHMVESRLAVNPLSRLAVMPFTSIIELLSGI